MKIGVTGATGLLGRNLCDLLKAKGYSVFEYDSKNLDIGKEVTFPELDVVYHLAADPWVHIAKKAPYNCFRTNAFGTLNVLEAAQRAGVTKIIYASSVMVYRNLENVSEEDALEPSGPYGWSKLMGEHLVKQYSDLFGMGYVILRPTALYGPGMYKNPIFDFVDGFLGRKKVVLYNSLDSKFDFVHARDAAYAFLLALGWKDVTLNVSSGEGTMLASMYDIFRQICKIDVPLEIKGNSRHCCIGKNSILKSLGWTQEYSLAEGIEEVLKYERSKKGVEK